MEITEKEIRAKCLLRKLKTQQSQSSTQKEASNGLSLADVAVVPLLIRVIEMVLLSYLNF